MDTKEIEKNIERLLVPINNKLDALPSKTDIEISKIRQRFNGHIIIIKNGTFG